MRGFVDFLGMRLLNGWLSKPKQNESEVSTFTHIAKKHAMWAHEKSYLNGFRV